MTKHQMLITLIATTGIKSSDPLPLHYRTHTFENPN